MVVHPGLYVLHGQIVIDGIVEIGPGAVIAPWVTIGLRAGNVQGATFGHGVHIGTGAKIIGPVTHRRHRADRRELPWSSNDVAAGCTGRRGPGASHEVSSD